MYAGPTSGDHKRDQIRLRAYRGPGATGGNILIRTRLCSLDWIDAGAKVNGLQIANGAYLAKGRANLEAPVTSRLILRYAVGQTQGRSDELLGSSMSTRKPPMLFIVALVNKTARMAWGADIPRGSLSGSVHGV
jgi:hypothetical protein